MGPRKQAMGWVLHAAVASLVVAGCFRHRPLDPESLNDLHRVAIVARVSSPGPVVRAARVDAREGRAFPQASPAEADRALAESIARQVRRFEIEERVRAAVLGNLPPGPPWSTAMPAIEVATALQRLLVEDRTGGVDLKALAARGADSVLLVEVDEYGVRHAAGKTGLFLSGECTLLRIDGRVLWRARLHLDESVRPGSAPVDVVWLSQDGFRDALLGLLADFGAEVGEQLSVRR